jgi:translin
MSDLEPIIERIRADLTQKDAVRTRTLERSRGLVRFCANSIRATHRHEYDAAHELLAQARTEAQAICAAARAYPDVYYAGYLQDALKELAEAAITLALVTGEPLPDPDAMQIDYPAYLNGLGEAMGEMRRFALDSMRRDEIAEAERLLTIMDDVYSALVTIDFADSMTGGLRRTTDMVRGVIERTRGDLTTAVRQEKLQAQLQALEVRLRSHAKPS